MRWGQSWHTRKSSWCTRKGSWRTRKDACARPAHVAAVAHTRGEPTRESRNASLFHAQGRQYAPLLDLDWGGRRIMSIPNL